MWRLESGLQICPKCRWLVVNSNRVPARELHPSSGFCSHFSFHSCRGPKPRAGKSQPEELAERHVARLREIFKQRNFFFFVACWVGIGEAARSVG